MVLRGGRAKRNAPLAPSASRLSVKKVTLGLHVVGGLGGHDRSLNLIERGGTRVTKVTVGWGCAGVASVSRGSRKGCGSRSDLESGWGWGWRTWIVTENSMLNGQRRSELRLEGATGGVPARVRVAPGGPLSLPSRRVPLAERPTLFNTIPD